MPRASVIQTSFNAGEFSPFLEGHVDAPKRASALKECQNMIPLVQGAATRRGGTRHISPVKDSANQTAIVRFEFSVTQAYIIEIGDQYMRFIRDNGNILEADQTITGITQANPAVVTITSHPFSDGDWVYISSVAGMTEVNNKFFKVANSATNTFELQDVYGNNIDSTSYTAYSSGGTAARVYEISTTYAQADLFDSDGVLRLRFNQSADVLYITHPDYAPRKLSRTGHTSWTLTELDFLDGPYLPTNTDSSKTLQPSGTTGSITITASGHSPFVSTDVGRLVRIKHSGTWGYAEITGFTSSTQVSADVKSDFGASTSQPDWRLGVYSETTGFPTVSTFFQDRLVFAGASNTPQRIDFSVSSDFENFAPTETDGTVLDDSAIGVTLNAENVNVIRWLANHEKGLLIGTVGAEWIVRASTAGEAITPTNIQATQTTSRGSANIPPAQVDNAVLFIQRAKRKLYRIAFVFEDDGFRSPDLTILAEHITRGGINQIVWQQEPHNILWAVRSDGVLLGFTYDTDQQVIGWHRHILGGYSDADQTTDAKVESIAVIPSADGSKDELYLIVNRYINGGTKRFIEYMTPVYDDSIDQEDAVHVDSCLTYDSTATTTISGLDHLEGEAVTLLTDGADHPDVTVSSGSITLQQSHSVVQVGLKNTWRLRTLGLEAGSADGTAQGKTKRISRVTLRLLNTLGVLFGDPDGDLDEYNFPAGDTGSAPPLYSGDSERIDWPSGYDKKAEMLFTGSTALPATILAIMPQVNTYN